MKQYHIISTPDGKMLRPLLTKEHGLTLTISEMDEIIGLSAYILNKK